MQSRERAHSRWWLFVLIPLALLLLAFLLYLFIRTDDASSCSERARKTEDPTTERYEPPIEQMQTDSIPPEDSAIIPIPETEEKAPAPVQTPSQTTKTAKATTSNRAFSSQVKTKPDAGRQLYTLKDGETLATVAQSVYGHSNFWIYIYNANRDKLSDPDSVWPGLTLTLPPLRDWGISASDPEAVRRAEELCEREKKNNCRRAIASAPCKRYCRDARLLLPPLPSPLYTDTPYSSHRNFPSLHGHSLIFAPKLPLFTRIRPNLRTETSPLYTDTPQS